MKINSLNIVIVSSLIALISFYTLLIMPEQKKISSQLILGQYHSEFNFDELTVIAKMPFLLHENTSVSMSTLAIDNDLFFTPRPITNEPEEPVKEEQVEDVAIQDFEPIKIPQIKIDYRSWALSNLRVQSITTNGAIINDKFYGVNKELEIYHSFEDGTQFDAMLSAINKSNITLHIKSDNSTVTLHLE